ncbi:hypothetical protein Q8A67_008926 [Cirrhinus molitorella]|uniref:Uncharacterized protein n=1 Tax=Cirrhinus molitorella TaxID=172907 RepID=A0AA88Q2Y3_9TELE|nr:hypothetical protein Q8A67_008926 [Cirrhinus molitorella]
MTLTVEGKNPVDLKTGEAPLAKSTKTYYYAGFNEADKIQKCDMDGNTADKATDTSNSNAATAKPTVKAPVSCPPNNNSSASEIINTVDPKMNSMNLLVTGLRILLAKCVAVNAMMTVKAFIF